MIEYIESAKEIVKDYNQFDNDNKLIDDIMHSHVINKNQAIQTATTICKVLTFWIEAFSKELMDLNFVDYYAKCIDKRYVRQNDKDGCFTYLTLDLFQLADRFNIQIKEIRKLEEFENYKPDEEWMGTVRIKTRSGMHSIICYRDQSGKIKIADTGKRGIDVPMVDYIDENNFQYFTEMIV